MLKMPRTHLLRGGNNSELDRVLVLICMVGQILCMVVAKKCAVSQETRVLLQPGIKKGDRVLASLSGLQRARVFRSA